MYIYPYYGGFFPAMQKDNAYFTGGAILERKENPMSVKPLNGPLRTERLNDGRRKLLRDYKIEIKGKVYTVPEGNFSTDFSSIPWYGRFVVRWSKVDIAGVVHDFLYQTGMENRRDSDEIWRLVALSGEHRANRLQARICWLALRVGGCCAWRRYRKAEEEAEVQNDNSGENSGTEA